MKLIKRLAVKRIIGSLLVGTLAVAITQSTHACSLAFLNTDRNTNVFARTLDLFVSDMPLMFVLPRGVEHVSQGDNPLKWKSKYGSVVVTTFHTDTASDGINEKGFAAHLLYLSQSKYEKRDSHIPALSNMLWAQYCLDNFKTVDEALDGMKKFQIISTELRGQEWPIHLAIEDASGDSAIIEFINGKMTIYHGPQFQVATNEPEYSIQLNNLKRYKLFGGRLAMPGDIDPMSRFVRASSYLKTLPKPTDNLQAVAGILSVIRTVMVPFGAENTAAGEHEDTWPTRWVSLGDLSNKIYYFSATTAPNIVWVDLNKINFAQNAPTLMLDPADPSLVGDITNSFHAPNN